MKKLLFITLIAASLLTACGKDEEKKSDSSATATQTAQTTTKNEDSESMIDDNLGTEDIDDNHEITIERVEDEHFITISHSMSKDHYISFIAYLTTDRVQFVKFYPEGNAETRMQFRGRGYLYIYCNKHGLMKKRV